METPVTIPNTEVKHFSGEDSERSQKQHVARQEGEELFLFFLYELETKIIDYRLLIIFVFLVEKWILIIVFYYLFKQSGKDHNER